MKKSTIVLTVIVSILIIIVSILVIIALALSASVAMDMLSHSSRNSIENYVPEDIYQYILYLERSADEHVCASGIDMTEIDLFVLTDEERSLIKEAIEKNEDIWHKYSSPSPEDNHLPWSIWDSITSDDIFKDFDKTECHYAIYDYRTAEFISISEIPFSFNLGIFIFDQQNGNYYFARFSN